MSIGVGVLILYGSYRAKDRDINHSSLLIPLVTCLCGFLAAAVVFSYMGFMSKISGIPLQEIPLRGTALAFVIFPAALTKLAFSNFWAVIFFILLFFLGIDT